MGYGAWVRQQGPARVLMHSCRVGAWHGCGGVLTVRLGCWWKLGDSGSRIPVRSLSPPLELLHRRVCRPLMPLTTSLPAPASTPHGRFHATAPPPRSTPNFPVATPQPAARPARPQPPTHLFAPPPLLHPHFPQSTTTWAPPCPTPHSTSASPAPAPWHIPCPNAPP